jgi:hypothetical protein
MEAKWPRWQNGVDTPWSSNGRPSKRMKTCENIHELAREMKIQRKLLYTWKYQFEGHPEPRHANLGITAEDRKEKQLREEITKLKSALADKTLEIDFF